jgi:hypothetical protein
MEDDAEGVASAAVHATDSVAEIHAVIAAGTFHGSIACGEDDGLALTRGNHFGFGLSTGLLLHQKEFAPFPIASRLPEQKNHLQWEGDFSIKILMQAVVAAGFVVQYQRRRLGLPRFVTDLQKRRVIEREGSFGSPKAFAHWFAMGARCE